MSWKLTKKLKETHLAPLANTFSRSSSTSTIVDQSTPKASSHAGSATTPSDSKDNGADASAPPAPPLRPGILIVTLHEGQKFSLPPGVEQQFSGGGHHQGSMSQGGGLSVAGSMRPDSSSRNAVAGSYTNRPQSAAGSINAAPTIHAGFHQCRLRYPENPLWAGSNTQYKFDVSRVTDLTVSLYIRNPSASPNAGRNEDIFIGTLKVHPRFEEQQQDAKAQKGDDAAGQAGADWISVQFGSGQMKIGVNFVENRQDRLAIDDFELLKVVGKGSFGKVMQVQKKDTHRIYALKTIRKAHIISRSEVAHTLAERSVLAQINNPFIVPLKFSFQSPEKLYLVLAFVNGGELFHHLQKEQRFDINRARFYAAELLCALECLHGFNVIYRDLKPENILLDYTGHIALCDFGLCKLDMKDEDRTNTFCGTPEYLAPELLTGAGYTKSVDWWTLGVLLYEMLTGLPPFYDENTNDMYRKILTEPLHFPGPEVVPPAARDLLTRLLDRNADKRLGAKGAAEIKAHYFFHSIDWRKLLERKYEPSFKPNVVDAKDTANFDREFTSEAPTDSYVDGPMLSQTMQQQFAGWSYNRPVAGLGDAGGSVKDPSFEGVTER
ncbi:hypothetical protein PTNB73_02659 [Pyrenophora teres f. teres]|nr:hypothetical protein PTNB73_02659 [Pyrenophora teres f. teres]